MEGPWTVVYNESFKSGRALALRNSSGWAVFYAPVFENGYYRLVMRVFVVGRVNVTVLIGNKTATFHLEKSAMEGVTLEFYGLRLSERDYHIILIVDLSENAYIILEYMELEKL